MNIFLTSGEPSFWRRVRDSFVVLARFRASTAIQRRAATRFLVFEDCPE